MQILLTYTIIYISTFYLSSHWIITNISVCILSISTLIFYIKVLNYSFQVGTGVILIIIGAGILTYEIERRSKV